MRIFFSVGEPSGDLHGANLIADLQKRNPHIEMVGFGGPKMADAGCHLLFDLTSLAVMGLWNVLLHVRKFLSLLADAERYFSTHRIEAVVLIDFPGFNWWIARKARRHGIQVFYYGVPQMWAWLPWRVRKLRRLVDHVMCKLPFEVPWFQRRGCQATFVGHPYFDELVRYPLDQPFLADCRTGDTRRLVLLPGSRTQEVHHNIDWLLEAAGKVRDRHPDLRIAVACFRESHAEYVKRRLPPDGLPVRIHVGRTPELIATADVCIACSGSVSLELLYHRKPTVIVYRITALAMLAQRVLLRTRFITLVNLLASERIEKSATPEYDPDRPDSPVPMPEYLRWRNCAGEIATWVCRWLDDPTARQRKVEQLDQLARAFAKPGASERAAEFIASRLADSGGKTLAKKPVAA